jgi:nitrogen fixation NifU-like protein
MNYSEKVMDHFNNPRNMGEIPDADGIGLVGNPICGDVMKIMIKVNKETEVIEDIKFKTFGCGAASSMVTEMIKGKSIKLDDALKISNKQVANALDGLPPQKLHCSVLAEDGLRSAIEDYRKKIRK